MFIVFALVSPRGVELSNRCVEDEDSIILSKKMKGGLSNQNFENKKLSSEYSFPDIVKLILV